MGRTRKPQQLPGNPTLLHTPDPRRHCGFSGGGHQEATGSRTPSPGKEVAGARGHYQSLGLTWRSRGLKQVSLGA